MNTVQSSPPQKPAPRTHKERDILDFGEQLTPMEKWQIRFVRGSFEQRGADRTIRTLQRHIGANWIDYCTRNLRHVHGLDRMPALDPAKSYLCVANHRSFFDLYVITAYLVKRGMPHRLVFPVRSKFFYDSALGFAVNGLMSFYAMYPPVFRERQRAALNLASLDEIVRLLRRGGSFVGIHPEGQRNKDGDPYALLPAQSGVGRVIHASRATVLPVFINGLNNDFIKQTSSNFTRKGDDVNVVFGEPVDFGDLLDRAPSPRLHRELSERAVSAIKDLAEEERALRQTRAR